MAEVIPFPLAMRHGLILRAAERLVYGDRDEGEHQLRQLIKQQVAVLTRKGVSPERVQAEIASLERAIRSAVWDLTFFGSAS